MNQDLILFVCGIVIIPVIIKIAMHVEHWIYKGYKRWSK